MEKRNLKKWLIPLALGGILLSGSLVSNNLIVNAETSSGSISSVVLQANHHAVTINNSTLDKAVRKLLGKNDTETLYSDAFLVHENFKATTVTDEETGLSTTTALTYQLDLSDTGVTDIRELSKFEFPTTLKGINLSGNNITNEHLDNIETLITATTSSAIIIGEETITPACDFAGIIQKVNLNDNKIDLFSLKESGSRHLDNTKFLFGIQNFGNIDSSGFVKKGEIEPVYFIRENIDENFLSFSFIFEFSVNSQEGEDQNTTGGPLTKQYNMPTRLLDLSTYPRETGKLNITVLSMPNSETAYFTGYSFNKEFILFDINLDSNFNVERKHALDLKLNSGKLTPQSPLRIDGFGTSLEISYNTPSTKYISTESRKHYVNITINYQNHSRTIPLEFKVVDTVSPVINLLMGGDHVYSSQHKPTSRFEEHGVAFTAHDPDIPNGDYGDDITSMVVVSSNVIFTTLGDYEITYTVSDLAGNSTTVKRTVTIVESVLDTIYVRHNNIGNIISGDEIKLVVEPDSHIKISNYSTIEYEWFLDGNSFITTFGDKQTGKSTTTITISDIGSHQIHVIARAKQLSNNSEIEVWSESLTVDIQANLRNNDTLILTVAIALGIIILVIIIISINKYRNSKGKTSGKHKNFHKKKKPSGSGTSHGNPNQPEIKVIKDYTGVDSGVNNGGGSGGNQNFRLPESQSNDNNSMNK